MKWSAVLLLTLSLVAPPLFAGKPTTAPGKYKEWGPDIDSIEIVRTFRITDYDRIVIPKFDTSKVELPGEKEKWYETMKIVLAGYTDAFAEAFKKELKATAVVEQSERTKKTGAKTLILRGTVNQLDPGSRAGRYFGGFGAGSASTQITVEIVGAGGEVLVRVTQARRSAGTWKPGAGSDLEVMRDAIHATAKDIAHVLDQFQP